MRTILTGVACLCLLSGASAVTQVHSDTDTLAVVDNTIITADDLFRRIELMPWIERPEDHDAATVKRKALASLVAERLLALDAEEQGIEKEVTDDVMQRALEKLFVRDELYRREIRSKITVTDSEIAEGSARLLKKRHLLLIRVPDESYALRLAGELQARENDEKQLGEFLDSQPFRRDTVSVTFGSAEPLLEEAAFRLRRKGQATGPVQSELYGAVVGILLGESLNRAAATLPAVDLLAKAELMIKERKERARQEQFLREVLGGRTMAVDSVLFPEVARRLHSAVRLDSAGHHVPGGYRYFPEDLDLLRIELMNRVKDPFIRGDFGEVSLEDVLEMLRYYQFTFLSLGPRTFAQSLLDALRILMEDEIVTLEGYRRQLQYSPDVQNDMALWKTHLKARRAMAQLQRGVVADSTDALRALWKRAPELVEPYLDVQICEILLGRQGYALELKRRTEEGESMEELARGFSLREEWREEGGVSEFFPLEDHLQLARGALACGPRDVSDPITTREGVSLVRLRGWRWRSGAPSFDSLLFQERRRLLVERQTAAVNRRCIQLARRYGVSLRVDRLEGISVSNFTVFTRRNIGFGGHLNAAPLLIPQWGWVEEWQKSLQQLP